VPDIQVASSVCDVLDVFSLCSVGCVRSDDTGRCEPIHAVTDALLARVCDWQDEFSQCAFPCYLSTDDADTSPPPQLESVPPSLPTHSASPPPLVYANPPPPLPLPPLLSSSPPSPSPPPPVPPCAEQNAPSVLQGLYRELCPTFSTCGECIEYSMQVNNKFCSWEGSRDVTTCGT